MWIFQTDGGIVGQEQLSKEAIMRLIRFFDDRSPLLTVLIVIGIPTVGFSDGTTPWRMDLSGTWSVRLDPDDSGENERWFATTLGDQTLNLPGSLQAQGYGNDVTVDTKWTGGINDQSWFTSPKYEKYRQPGNVKVPFWLQPEKHYVGPAWYQRSLTVPDDWHGKRISLQLERCHWETAVWVDDTKIGSENSLSTPHTYGTWFEARRLGLVVEAKVHGGKLMICSIDLTKKLADNPVARQMRHGLLDYMSSDKFDPQVDVSVRAIGGLMRSLPKMQRLGATVTTDSQQPGYPASNVLDGDPTTIWHTGWGDREKTFPHHVIIDLQKPIKIAGLACLPRQDMENGRIAKFDVYLSNDGTSWDKPVAAGTWANTKELQRVQFDVPQRTRYVKLVAESEVNVNVWASVAEVEVVTE